MSQEGIDLNLGLTMPDGSPADIYTSYHGPVRSFMPGYTHAQRVFETMSNEVYQAGWEGGENVQILGSQGSVAQIEQEVGLDDANQWIWGQAHRSMYPIESYQEPLMQPPVQGPVPNVQLDNPYTYTPPRQRATSYAQNLLKYVPGFIAAGGFTGLYKAATKTADTVMHKQEDKGKKPTVAVVQQTPALDPITRELGFTPK